MSAAKFPVEAGHIMMFARAIGDPVGSVAPPTFVEGAMHDDEAFPYRPRIGEPWFGSAAEPASAPPPAPAAAGGVEGGTSFHAETRLEYHGVLRPGDVLDVRERRGPSWRKEGSRGGRLWFSTVVTDFLRGEDLVVRSTMVVVSTEAKVDQEVGGPNREVADESEAPRPGRPSRTVPSPERGPSSPPSPGDAHELVLVENLSRAQILLYAAASGDFSPQHTDEIWNTRVAGYPSVFAHGMLTMGMTGRVLTDWFGVESLRAFDMRFMRQVWPGDDLIARAEVEALREREDAVRLELTVATRNQHGETVAAGSAKVELAR